MPVLTIRYRHAALLAAAITTAAAASGLTLLSGPSGAAEPSGQASTAQLVQMTVTPVGPLGIAGFQGSYGKADSPEIGPDDPGDFSDPDGVLNYISLDGATVTRTSNTTGKVYGQAQSSGMSLTFPSVASFVQVVPAAGSVSTLDSYAECIPKPVGLFAFAYARTAGALIEVLGHLVPVGTTTLQVTGAELQHPATLGPSTLTVSYFPHQEPDSAAAVPGLGTARAWVDIKVSGVLRDTSGAQVYSGDIVSLRLGQVTATCEQVLPTSPPPIPPTNPPVTPSTEPPTTPPTEPPTTPPTTPPTEPPTTPPTTPTTAPPTEPPPTPPPTRPTAPPTTTPTATAKPTGGGHLAGTGDDPGPLAGAALALAALGTTVVTVLHLRRRPRRH
ncbi:hypothetical protein ACEZCY_07285 [Streptacidiphilus sp. N1-12]|uniref:Uncharacterized protein n=2 Tax=Streptacidiphilus alkalitolerans TaxID=3342712 RepID=A0ABV6VL88_9ACTN